jgi:GNAT superfamily N-acetyltransferase/carbonic anhydrase/acetyltransferase-like protein (isoleucine patch superfamily)
MDSSPPPLAFRPAQAEDCALLFHWANDPAVRGNARSPDPIAWDGHQGWFAKRLTSVDCRIFIACDGPDGTPLGQVRLDRDGWRAEVDIAVDALARGRGVGVALLAHAAQQARGWVDHLWSAVKTSNTASLALFRAAGFAEQGPVSDPSGHYTTFCLPLPITGQAMAVDAAQLALCVAQRGGDPAPILGRSFLLSGVKPLDQAGPSDMAFCHFDGEQGLRYIAGSKAGAIFVPDSLRDALPSEGPTLYLPCATPRLEILHVLIRFWREVEWDANPQANPCVHPQAKIGKNVRIGPFTVIGPDVEIADNVKIGSHCHLDHCTVGADSLITTSVTIGGGDFGYETDDATGALLQVPHVGGVRIGQRVEIGSSACLDRGSIGDTVIGDDSKIDSLVHIAHNVRMGSSKSRADGIVCDDAFAEITKK